MIFVGYSIGLSSIGIVFGDICISDFLGEIDFFSILFSRPLYQSLIGEVYF